MYTCTSTKLIHFHQCLGISKVDTVSDLNTTGCFIFRLIWISFKLNCVSNIKHNFYLNIALPFLPTSLKLNMFKMSCSCKALDDMTPSYIGFTLSVPLWFTLPFSLWFTLSFPLWFTLSVHLWFTLAVHLWFILSVHLWFTLAVHLWFTLAVHLWFTLSVHLCFTLSVHLWFTLSVHLWFTLSVPLWFTLSVHLWFTLAVHLWFTLSVPLSKWRVSAIFTLWMIWYWWNSCSIHPKGSACKDNPGLNYFQG